MCNISVWIYSPRNKIFPAMSVALIAHHAPILSCNETSFINTMVFHAGQYLVFWEFTNPLSWTQPSSLSRTNVGSVSPICTRCRYTFAKFTLAVRCALLGLWTTVVICGCKFSCFISCPALDADTSVCCEGQTDNFLVDVARIAAVAYCFYSVSTCLLSGMEPVAGDLPCHIWVNRNKHLDRKWPMMWVSYSEGPVHTMCFTSITLLCFRVLVWFCMC